MVLFYKENLSFINYFIIVRSYLYSKVRLSAPFAIFENNSLFSQYLTKVTNEVLWLSFSISINSWIFNVFDLLESLLLLFLLILKLSHFWPVEVSSVCPQSLDGVPAFLGVRFSRCNLHTFPLRPEEPDLQTHSHMVTGSSPTKKARPWARQLRSGWPCRMGKWRLRTDCTHQSWIFGPSWEETWVKHLSIHCTCTFWDIWGRPPGRVHRVSLTFIMCYSNTERVNRRPYKGNGKKDQMGRKKTRKTWCYCNLFFPTTTVFAWHLEQCLALERTE